MIGEDADLERKVTRAVISKLRLINPEKFIRIENEWHCFRGKSFSGYRLEDAENSHISYIYSIEDISKDEVSKIYISSSIYLNSINDVHQKELFELNINASDYWKIVKPIKDIILKKENKEEKERKEKRNKLF